MTTEKQQNGTFYAAILDDSKRTTMIARLSRLAKTLNILGMVGAFIFVITMLANQKASLQIVTSFIAIIIWVLALQCESYVRLVKVFDVIRKDAQANPKMAK